MRFFLHFHEFLTILSLPIISADISPIYPKYLRYIRYIRKIELPIYPWLPIFSSLDVTLHQKVIVREIGQWRVGPCSYTFLKGLDFSWFSSIKEWPLNNTEWFKEKENAKDQFNMIRVVKTSVIDIHWITSRKKISIK